MPRSERKAINGSHGRDRIQFKITRKGSFSRWFCKIQNLVLLIMANQWLGIALNKYLSLVDCEVLDSQVVFSESRKLNVKPESKQGSISKKKAKNTAETYSDSSSSEDDDDDEYIWEPPRIFLNMTLWSSSASALERTTIVEEKQVGQMALIVKKQLCVRGENKNSTLPSCPRPKLCKSQFFDNSGNCLIPEYVIDKKEFWKGLKDMVIYLDTNTSSTNTSSTKPKKFFRLTSWDSIAKAHHMVDKDWFKVVRCNDEGIGRKVCPSDCIFEKSVVWDHRDGLCKILDPKRPWIGKCSCHNTCMTPQSGERDSSWPWESHSMREQFYGTDHSKNKLKKFKLRQRDCRMRHFEGKPKDYFQESTACSYIEQNQSSKFSLSCEAHATGWHHLYFSPKAKLIFCGIPKVGVSEWLKLFRRLTGAGDYLSLPHFKQDLTEFHLSSLPLKQAEAMLTDPSWTKAVFFRDPAERLLSAYLDKIVGEGYTQKFFHIGSGRGPNPTVLSFEEFVNLTANTIRKNKHDRKGVHYKSDPHWKPQMLSCGLDQLFPMFDFVGSFNHISEHSMQLLKELGIWESHGKVFDLSRHEELREPKGRKLSQAKSCMITQPNLTDTSVSVVGFNQLAGNIESKQHQTGAREKMNQYYTPEIYRMVRKAYAMDYAIWDELQSRLQKNPKQIPSGRSFQFVKKSCAV